MYAMPGCAKAKRSHDYVGDAREPRYAAGDGADLRSRGMKFEDVEVAARQVRAADALGWVDERRQRDAAAVRSAEQ